MITKVYEELPQSVQPLATNFVVQDLRLIFTVVNKLKLSHLLQFKPQLWNVPNTMHCEHQCEHFTSSPK